MNASPVVKNHVSPNQRSYAPKSSPPVRGILPERRPEGGDTGATQPLFSPDCPAQPNTIFLIRLHPVERDGKIQPMPHGRGAKPTALEAVSEEYRNGRQGARQSLR